MSLNLPGFETPKVPSISGSTPNQSRCPPPSIPAHDLLRVIGSGSYGEVWLARNVMGTYRAVKVVYRDNFETERPYAREFSGIQKFEPVSRTHEGLVDILQVERNDQAGYFYYVMELADGVLDARCPIPDPGCRMPDAGSPSRESTARHPSSSIQNPVSSIKDPATSINPSTYSPKTIRAEISKRGRLPFDECLELSLSLTAALGHLHKAGLVHRDIKPSNIIFVNGLPKLADIGLVAAASEARSFVGTEGFIPPEGPGTAQADIYSLGKVIYEIATGKDRQSFPEPPTVLPELTDRSRLLELNEVILRACETTVANRYQSAKEMHDDLVLLQTGGSVRRLRVMEKRFARARRIGAIAIAAVLVVGAVLFETARTKAQTTQRLVRQYVGNGTRLMNEGDLFGSLLWFTEALKLDAGDPKREEPHRIRIASVLRQCPKLLNVFSHGNMLYHAEFSPDGSKVLTSSDDHTARLWDATSGQRLLVLQHGDEVYDARFSPDNLRIITSCQDKAARIWDAKTGALLTTLLHRDIVWLGCFSHDGQLVATACQDGTAQVWDARTGARVGPPMEHGGRVPDGVSFSPDGLWLGTTDNKGLGYVWEVGTGLERFKNDHHGNTISFSRDSRLFLTDENDSLHIWDARTVKEVAYSPLHLNELNYSGFSPDGRAIVGCGNGFTAQVWDTITGKPLFSPPVRHTGPILMAAISPDERRFATAGQDTVAQVWNKATGEPVGPPFRLILHVKKISYNPDGRRLLGVSCDQAARVWDLATGDLPGPARPDLEDEHRLTSPDGRFALASGESNQVLIVDTTSGQTFRVLPHANEVTYASFSRDGKSVITACQRYVAPSSMPNDIFLWDARTGQRLNSYEMRHPFQLLYAAFSPDNTRLLTCGFDFTARLWDARTGRPLSEPLRHREQISWGAFDPDGRSVVTVSLDRTARVWDGFNGKPLTPPLQHKAAVTGAFWSADGKRLHTVTTDDYLNVWDLRTADPLTPPRKIRDAGGYVLTLPDGPAPGYTGDVLPRDDRPVAYLIRLAQMLAVSRIDDSGDAVPLELSAFTSAWEMLRQEHPEQFRATPSEVIAWHSEELAESETETNRQAALFHLDRLAALKSEDAEFQKQCADERRVITNGGIALVSLPKPAMRIATRDPKAPSNLLDLAPFFNWSITDDFEGPGKRFHGLHPGILTLGGMGFDVRGLILLDGQGERNGGKAPPPRVDGIRMDRKCRQLHFLQATTWNATQEVAVGKYILHYKDGQQRELELKYGRDLSDWWPDDGSHITSYNPTDGRTAEIRFASGASSRRLYKNTRANPRPDVEISTIDFVSTVTLASPFLVAITVE